VESARHVDLGLAAGGWRSKVLAEGCFQLTWRASPAPAEEAAVRSTGVRRFVVFAIVFSSLAGLGYAGTGGAG
jgi:hypothetical protein